MLRRVDAERVVVEGVNRVKKHVKPNPVKGVAGGVVDKDMPLHISNVSLYNPATKKADRVGFKSLGRWHEGACFRVEWRSGGGVRSDHGAFV